MLSKNFTGRTGWVAFFASISLSVLSFSANAEDNSVSDSHDQSQVVTDSDNSGTEESLVDERIEQEEKVIDNPFVITPYKANYIMPVTYMSHTNDEPFKEALEDDYQPLDNTEAKFQISFKMPLSTHLFDDTGDLYFAYTNQSWWQVYNKSSSSPFRETVHEPELFLQFKNDWKVAGFTNSLWQVGLNHQSNGQSGELSRSWNRVFGEMVFDKGPFALGLKTWWRIPESDKSSPSDASGDDNPDINHYMGNFELTGLYGVDKHRFAVVLRDNLEFGDNKGAVQLSWSYPILNNLRVYVQYFNGYGESLIDYNYHIQRVGVGIALNDLL
ncbi:phospholipase A [Vibrio sp.]|uniref:Phospholipase A1 n=1 Tax=Vibrio viridaestus TaxID=2487322 RepID=A0A3N9U0P5_9VIBR|nr:phospholipase A [Vibrio viridaestus]MDC0611767.1 phospholipase A [Vibrio sp.]RQW62812.1 phospholipase [Vibrio viridaestus]